MSVKKLSENAKTLIVQIKMASSIPALGAVVGVVFHAKKKKMISAGEYNAILELGAKKEAILHAQGYR